MCERRILEELQMEKQNLTHQNRREEKQEKEVIEMEKCITFVVPCYNSQDYMKRCIDSLLAGGKDIEIIIIDDGSTDHTGDIADVYETNYPDIVKVVHKENGGHGSGVNAGLQIARGTYFKVVDSDDWLDEHAYMIVLQKLKKYSTLEARHLISNMPDLIVTNYVYDHLEEKTYRVMGYKNVFPIQTICSWNEIKHFLPTQYLIMHALIFRTDLLRKAGIQLPEHTFYVDNLFAYQPLPNVKYIYYMDVDLYHYFLGREDQSVNENILMERIDQQIRVTELVAGCVDLGEVKEKTPKLAAYMYRNISIMMAISSIHLLLIGTEEAYEKREKLWREIKKENKGMYYRLRYTTLSGLTYLPGKLGGKITLSGYQAAKKIYQFQ